MRTRLTVLIMVFTLMFTGVGCEGESRVLNNGGHFVTYGDNSCYKE